MSATAPAPFLLLFPPPPFFFFGAVPTHASRSAVTAASVSAFTTIASTFAFPPSLVSMSLRMSALSGACVASTLLTSTLAIAALCSALEPISSLPSSRPPPPPVSVCTRRVFASAARNPSRNSSFETSSSPSASSTARTLRARDSSPVPASACAISDASRTPSALVSKPSKSTSHRGGGARASRPSRNARLSALPAAERWRAQIETSQMHQLRRSERISAASQHSTKAFAAVMASSSFWRSAACSAEPTC
mmetsp:Transcript_9163/g.30172  ORF Transcript_9163/g.30172 Transcript_9163/m.30172 type:complete len:250 (-) Transcript_9163:321-1070(-)